MRADREMARSPVYLEVVTWVLFLPLLILIARHVPYFAGPAVTSTEYQNGTGGGEGAGRLPGYAMMIIQGLLIWMHRRKIVAALAQNKWILAQICWAFTSALWATAPQVSFQMSIAVSLCTLFAFYLSVRLQPEHFMRLLLFMGVVTSLMTVIFALALPRYGIFAGYGGGAWQGIADQKNSLGITTAFLLTPIFFTRRPSVLAKTGYVLFLLFIIYKSQSKGAWMETIAMLGFVICVHIYQRLPSKDSAFFLVCVLMCLGCASVIIFLKFDSIAQLLGKDSSMSGRTGIYGEVWLSAMKRPLTGYGFNSFWGLHPSNVEARRIGYVIGWSNIGYSENGILEILIQLGFIGVVLVMGMFVKAVIQGCRLLRSTAYAPRTGWFLTVIFLALITNIEAGWLMTLNTLDWVLIVVACVGITRERNRELKRPVPVLGVAQAS